MSDRQSSEPAEKISDRDLLAHVAAVLEKSETPFTTTGQVNDIVDELKSDQIRNRLKTLAEEEENLAYANSRGLVFWLPDDEQITGAIDTELETDNPNWEEVTIDELPSNLIEDAAEAHKQQKVEYPKLNELSEVSLRVGFYFFIFVFLMAFGEAFAIQGVLSGRWQDLVVAGLVVCIFSFAIHAILSVFITVSKWHRSGDNVGRRLNPFE